MKAPAILLAAALACGGAAFAADTHDNGAAGSSARQTAHQLAGDFKQAMHKLGAATRRVLHRADAAIHRSGKHDT
ncbi:hypothetical protein [Ramlibacter alkalitolerans]|jgi:hypothetical protein|uniref:Uncharacterized protein n=1 Tax=Ramlibacter alkalitolerans TaxID=2039631 RepID=A0ABS1JQM8_9BURK|nr:hypothetical protein [Ramlibacter alkalitolerans]MBL0426557.1 hypothetical protein [Ramlibacter alkalitolerans]